MMKNYRILWIVILALCGSLIPLAAAEAGIDFNIRFFDRRIYYVTSDPIFIQVSVTNNSSSAYRFKLADERGFSLDFEVRTTGNRLLEPADVLIRRRTQSGQVFFREILVESGETFSFVEDLRSYAKLDEPGAFVVRARLFPELFRPVASGINASGINAGSINAGSINASGINTGINSAAVTSAGILESQRISLNIRPPVVYSQEGLPLEMDVATGALLVRERLAPDQTVEYMLTARQKSQWEKFFLYLDLEEMLSRDPVRQRKWLAESGEGRRRLVEQYRLELQNTVTDGTISVIPTEFAIERTQYSGFEGTVIALQKYRSDNFTEIKRYTYYMRLKDSIWTIVDYSVNNLGTE